MTRRTISAALALALLAGSAAAEGDALIVGNGDYSLFDRLKGAGRILGAVEPLEAQGFAVVTAEEAGADGLRDALRGFLRGLDGETDRVVVILSGRFAHTASDAYLLPVGLDAPVDEAEALTSALPLSVVLGVLAEYPGRAVLALGEGDIEPLGARHLEAGAGAVDVPQGVTLLRGEPEEVAALARDVLADPGATLVPAAEDGDVAVSGFAPRDYVFLGAARPAPEPEPEPTAEPEPELREDARDPAEERLWTSVMDRDQIEGYRNYLAAYPEGRHAAEARNRIEDLDRSPAARAEADEDALDLSRDERRAIQRDLSLLDYNTRGIDGIFGPGTRSAVERWQEANDFQTTGFLTREQITRLDGQAARRQAELEEEAARRQEEQERQDRAYWEETGAEGDAAGLRAYLDRFPDGVYAEDAQSRLDDIEADRRAEAQSRERDAWQRARDEGSVAAYRRYMDEYPDGAFAGDAQAAIDALQRPSEDRQAAARAEAEEAALNLPPTARRIAEDRLRAQGLKPGEVDGVFDENTRRAIRRYQDARSLRVTGYLDQSTVVRLLADSLLGSR